MEPVAGFPGSEAPRILKLGPGFGKGEIGRRAGRAN
jgi:hypothetical protein